MANLKPGDKAPEFTSIDQNGKTVKLSDYKGKKLILYFYPKDNTPGCTDEACSLRDGYAEFKQKGYEILGVSADSEKSHQGFIAKYELPFNLLSDVDKSVLKAYGAWGEKKLYGRAYMGIVRSAFLVDESGKLSGIWYKVSPKDTPKNLLAALAGK